MKWLLLGSLISFIRRNPFLSLIGAVVLLLFVSGVVSRATAEWTLVVAFVLMCIIGITIRERQNEG